MLFLKLQMFRKDLVAIAEAAVDADQEKIAEFVADMKAAGLYAEPTEDDFERLDELV